MNFLKSINSILNFGRNTWTEKELVDFRNKLLQVITWTEQLSKGFDFENGKYGLVFRQTNPIYKELPLYQFGRQSDEISGHNFDYDFGEDYTSWNDMDYSLDSYDYLLNEAIKSRIGNANFNLSELDSLGRILSFQTCITTQDGAPIVESKNFVDESDVPPIDTWFYLKRDYFHSQYRCDQVLFCWIPKKFEELIQQAMEVEILDSYRWLDDNDAKFYQRIINSK